MIRQNYYSRITKSKVVTMNVIKTKEKILIAARKLFTKHGFNGVAVGKIAELAKVNHSLIFHHYGNKEKLWVAVKQHIIAEIDENPKLQPDSNLPIESFIKQLFLTKYNFYQSNNDAIRIINWQRMEFNSDDSSSINTTHAYNHNIAAIRLYQERGDINQSIDPDFIIITINSIIKSAALDSMFLIKSKKKHDDYKEFCIESIMKIIQ